MFLKCVQNQNSGTTEKLLGTYNVLGWSYASQYTSLMCEIDCTDYNYLKYKRSGSLTDTVSTVNAIYDKSPFTSGYTKIHAISLTASTTEVTVDVSQYNSVYLTLITAIAYPSTAGLYDVKLTK